MELFRNTPLWDNKLPIEDRLNFLLQELTIEEKIKCLTTGCPSVERLGIKPSYMGGEAAHGIEARHDQAFNAGEPEPTTSFTQPIGMSASFDRELIKECGRAVGEEARALFTRNGGGGLCRWAPTVDMERDPRWGRTEEAYGEDPYLTGEMASAYIQGMKGNHSVYLQCGATLKHFYANNVETNRIKVSSSLDDRNKYEYYLEPFRKTIMEGGAEAVMTSYNEINGIPAIVNDEVQKLLKDAWGLPGHVVCDGGDFQQTVNDHKYYKTHAETIAYGLKAGIDCFTDDGEVVYAAAKEALEKGLITEKDIDSSIRNSFRTRIRLGFFDGDGECPYTGMGEEYINNKEHQELAAQMAESSVVMLKNEKEILPIKRGQTNSLAVIGPLADVWYKDWYSGIPPYSVSVLEGMKKAYSDTDITYENSLHEIYLTCNGNYVGLDKENKLCLKEKEEAELFIYTDWGFGSSNLIAKSNQKYITLDETSGLLKADKEEAFSWFIKESFHFKSIENLQYHMDSWNGREIAIDSSGYLGVIPTEEIKQGESGKEPLFLKSNELWEGQPAVFNMEIVKDGIREAMIAAEKADKAVVVIGCNPVINSKEEVDRTTLELPPMQQQLVDSVLKVNPQTIVVLISNYPYAIRNIDLEVPAILWSASGSQELGNGIASIISGQVSPAGRLNMTWYQSDEDLPDINDYDIIQGKRTYQYFDQDVLYPFGYGLSYTKFKYDTIEVNQVEKGIQVKVHVTNVGKMVSDEVVQLYAHKETSRVKQPLLKLQGFERVKGIKPNETRQVEFLVNIDELRYFDVISQGMILESSFYTFMVGGSSQDIRQTAQIWIEGQEIGSRNPFTVTEAKQYDSYENCFIHKGIEGYTCIIPGIPGVDTDQKAQEMISQGSDVLAKVCYKDFDFRKEPTVIVVTVSVLEQGKITIISHGETEACVCESLHPTEDFTDIVLTLPRDFVQCNSQQGISIQIEGKIKLCRFSFQD